MEYIPPIHDQRLEKVDSDNRHHPGAHNDNICQDKDPRHALQSVSHQCHEGDHTISLDIVILDHWMFLSVQKGQEEDFLQDSLYILD